MSFHDMHIVVFIFGVRSSKVIRVSPSTMPVQLNGSSWVTQPYTAVHGVVIFRLPRLFAATTTGDPDASPYFRPIFHLFTHIYTYLRPFPPYIGAPHHLRFWKIATLAEHRAYAADAWVNTRKSHITLRGQGARFYIS
jgi:hypothetical protein